MTDQHDKLRAPKFGEWIRGNSASESNPIRDGMYVRTIHRTGLVNPGTFYELTDGKGKFWQYEAKNTTRLAEPAADGDAFSGRLLTVEGVTFGVPAQFYARIEKALSEPAALPVGNAVMWRAQQAGGKWMYFDYEPKHLQRYEPLYAAPLAAEGDAIEKFAKWHKAWPLTDAQREALATPPTPEQPKRPEPCYCCRCHPTLGDPSATPPATAPCQRSKGCPTCGAQRTDGCEEGCPRLARMLAEQPAQRGEEQS